MNCYTLNRLFVYGLWTALFSVSTAVLAQESCPALVAQALSELNTSCSDVGRNTACYGFDEVSARFTTPVADDYFAIPSDQAAIAEVSSLQTAPMNLENDQWGVALLSVQASMPDSLPGQNAIFVLLGDTEVENAVAQDEALQTVDPLSVTTGVSANIRSGPGLDYNTIGGAAAGTVLQADGIDETGTWLRIVYAERAAWINAVVLQPAEFAALPVLDETARTPMQSFYLRTGIGEPACVEAPRDGLIVQGPQNVKLDFTVNGANVRIGSTVVFNTPDANTLQISVLDGEAVVIGGAENGGDVVVRAGYKTTACLGEADDLGLDGEANDRVVGCGFTSPVRDTNQTQDYCSLQTLQSDMLYYPVNLACPGDAPVQQAADTSTDSGSCADFRVLSPNGSGTPFNEATYSWTRVDEADEYVINFQEPDGNFLIASYVGNVTSTNYRNASLNRNEFRWVVLALKNQQILCSTPPADTVTRLANPEEAPADTSVVTAPGPWAISYVCGPSTYNIVWQNRDALGTGGLTFAGTLTPGGTFSAVSGNATSGSFSPPFTGTVSWFVVPAYTPSGSFAVSCP